MNISDEPRSYSNLYQDSNLAHHYETDIYRVGSHDEVLWQVEKIHLHKLIRSQFSSHIEADAMDFACGTGRITSFLHPLVRSVVGVDISDRMLDRARRNLPNTRLICADITADPDSIPDEMDIITVFRFLLLAEPNLRRSVLCQLAEKLRNHRSIIIFSLHGNPYSYRALASLRNRLLVRRTPPLPAFSMRDMNQLAEDCNLKIVAATGLGYVPHSFSRYIPTEAHQGSERLLAGWPLLWRLGSNLLVVCRKK